VPRLRGKNQLAVSDCGIFNRIGFFNSNIFLLFFSAFGLVLLVFGDLGFGGGVVDFNVGD